MFLVEEGMLKELIRQEYQRAKKKGLVDARGHARQQAEEFIGVLEASSSMKEQLRVVMEQHLKTLA